MAHILSDGNEAVQERDWLFFRLGYNGWQSDDREDTSL